MRQDMAAFIEITYLALIDKTPGDIRQTDSPSPDVCTSLCSCDEELLNFSHEYTNRMTETKQLLIKWLSIKSDHFHDDMT